MRRLARGAALVGLAAGCASLPGFGPRIARCPGPLPDAASIPGGDFLLREKLRVKGPEVELGLELVAERRGERLVLVGFDAFGARVFSVEQRGAEVAIDSRLGRALALPPENALRDWHAARRVERSDEPRVELARPGCDYRASFVRVERHALD